MSFSTKIEVLKFPHERIMLCIEPYWWPARELMKEERFSEVTLTLGYLDYIAELSVQDFLELHSKYRSRAIRDENLHDRTRALVTMLDQLEYLLDFENDRIRVTVYEWESGLD